MKKTLLLVLLCCIINLAFNKISAQLNVNDSLALVDLYNSTDGPHWRDHTNWLTSKPVSTWYGFQLSDDGKRVIEIFLSNNKLTGTIPASIGNFEYLLTLDLSDNNLSGAIPAEVG